MIDRVGEKTEKSLVQEVEQSLESWKKEGPDVIQKLKEGLGPVITLLGPKIAEALESIAPQIEAALQPAERLRTDAQTYSGVVKLLESEIKRGATRIAVYSRGGGNFFFRLEDREPLKITNITKERFDWIVNNEVFNILHYVYWANRDGYLREAGKRGELEEEALGRFEATTALLTSDLEQRILLARSQTAHSLVYVAQEVIRRTLQTNDRTQLLESILVKLIIRDNLLADQYNPWSIASFELTVSDLKILVRQLQETVELLEHKDATL